MQIMFFCWGGHHDDGTHLSVLRGYSQPCLQAQCLAVLQEPCVVVKIGTRFAAAATYQAGTLFFFLQPMHFLKPYLDRKES